MIIVPVSKAVPGVVPPLELRNSVIMGRDVAVSVLWKARIPGIVGIIGRDVAVSLVPPLEFRNSGNYGKRCRCLAITSAFPQFRELLEL